MSFIFFTPYRISRIRYHRSDVMRIYILHSFVYVSYVEPHQTYKIMAGRCGNTSMLWFPLSACIKRVAGHTASWPYCRTPGKYMRDLLRFCLLHVRATPRSWQPIHPSRKRSRLYACCITPRVQVPKSGVLAQRTSDIISLVLGPLGVQEQLFNAWFILL